MSQALSIKPRFSFLRMIRQDPFNTLLALIILAAIAYGLVQAFNWLVIDSVWMATSASECRSIASGACWAVLRERGRLVFFGLYPFDEQWRAVLACIILISAVVLSCLGPIQRAKRLIALWVVAFVSFTVLMGGGVFGLVPVPQSNWGGLALSLYIFMSMLFIGMPLAIVFALARHSGPTWASVSVGIIVDFIRSIPLTVILFFVALVLPTLVSGWIAGDKLWRVIAGFGLFFACYQAEILRGALQGLSVGQIEASKALGMNYWHTQTQIVLPQIFRTALPQTVNQIVTAFKDTSYVAIVGFFDMTASASAALGSGEWASAFVEVYLFVGAIYLVFGYALSRYGGYLESKMDKALVR